jgi:hypothetical protein
LLFILRRETKIKQNLKNKETDYKIVKSQKKKS